MRSAVFYAVRAGELLAKAKAALPHGEFGAFCAKLPFAETTARGYMRLASLDPENRQRVAGLPLRTALLEVAQPRRWLPEPGHWHIYCNDDAAFHVVPALGYPAFFHISKLWSDSDDDLFWRGTWSPIPTSLVDARLRYFGLANARSIFWEKSPHRGLPEAFGKLEDEPSQLVLRAKEQERPQPTTA